MRMAAMYISDLACSYSMNISTMRCCSNLELADGLAELLARLAILHRVLVQHLHAAHRFSAHRQNAFVDHLFEQRQAAALLAEQSVRADPPHRRGLFPRR